MKCPCSSVFAQNSSAGLKRVTGRVSGSRRHHAPSAGISPAHRPGWSPFGRPGTEQKAAVRHLIDRGVELRRLDRVALLHQGQK